MDTSTPKISSRPPLIRKVIIGRLLVCCPRLELLSTMNIPTGDESAFTVLRVRGDHFAIFFFDDTSGAIDFEAAQAMAAAEDGNDEMRRRRNAVLRLEQDTRRQRSLGEREERPIFVVQSTTSDLLSGKEEPTRYFLVFRHEVRAAAEVCPNEFVEVQGCDKRLSRFMRPAASTEYVCVEHGRVFRVNLMVDEGA